MLCDKILLIILLVSLSLCIKRYHPLYFSEYGLLVEPNGVVVSYDDVKYVSLIINFPGIQKMNNRLSCGKNVSEQLYRNTIKHQFKMLFDHIPSTTHSIMTEYCENHHSLCLDLEKSKNKRQILPAIAALTGIAGLATSAYDWFKSNDLRNHLEEVSGHINKIDNRLLEQDESIYSIKSLSNDIIKRSSLSFQNYHRYLMKLICNQEEIDTLLSQSSSLSNLEFEILSLQKMVNGNPDSYLVNSEVISLLINTNSDLKTCIYNEDMSIFYQVVKSNLIHSDITKSMFVFLLEIPIIHKTMISPLYKVYNGGWEIKGILNKIDLPNSFYLYSSKEEKDFHAISLGDGNCWKRSEIIICDNSKHMLTEDMICLNSLLRKQLFDTCDIKLSKLIREVSVVKSLSGILITGNIPVQLISSAGSEFHYITNTKQISNYTQFYPYTEFKQIIVGSMIIKSNNDKIPVVHRNDTHLIQIDMDFDWVNNFLSDKSWSSLKEIKNLKLSGWDFYHQSLSYQINKWSVPIWLIILITVLLMTITLIIFCNKLKKLESQIRVSNKLIKAVNNR